MNFHQKVLAIIFEKSISKLLNSNGFNTLNSFSNGIDIYIRDLDLYIEVKSSFRYCKNNKKNSKRKFRFSQYSFKPNELLGCQEFYIFIEKVNTIKDFHYIGKLIIFVVKTSIIRKYMNSKSMELSIRHQISTNVIKKLLKYSINEFIDLIKK